MKNMSVFAYGVFAYVAFLASFTYLLGFVLSAVVPKGINDGVPDPSVFGLLVNLSLILLFAVQHTIMARRSFKKKFNLMFPAAAERSTYVLASSIILTVLYWQWRPMPEVIWHVENSILAGALYAVSLFGFGIVLYSSFIIDHWDLFGLKQVFLHLREKQYAFPKLKIVSLYRYVRHPLMVGIIIMIWSTPLMTTGHLLFAGCMTLYIVLGIKIEERSLVEGLGEDYRKYRETTPALIPGKRLAASNES